ncbi:MAG: hypothetical protein AAF938_04920 [Myxococcota bacterium]
MALSGPSEAASQWEATRLSGGRMKSSHAPRPMHAMFAVGTAAAVGAVVTCVGGKDVQTGAQSMGHHLRFHLHWAQ